MGKKLIIKGADFSENGIAPVATQIKGVKTSADNQVVKLIIPIGLSTDSNYKIKFAVNTLLNHGDIVAYLGNIYTNRSDVKCGYTDGRMVFTINGKRGDLMSPFIPTLGTTNEVFVKTNTTIINGISYANTDGSEESNQNCNGKVTLFSTVGAGKVTISEVEVYDNTGTTLKAKYVAAKDANNKACLWDKLTDTLCYANEGDLVAIMD